MEFLEDQSPLPPNPETMMSEEDKETFMRISGEDRNKKSDKPKRPYSTTSSVYAEHTLSNPDNDQVIYCIGAILQAQIFDDLMMNGEPNPDEYPEFNLVIDLPPEYGGPVRDVPESIINHEALNDLQLRAKLIEGAVPTVDTIYRFLKMMITWARYSVECNILALVYINRINTRNQLSLTMLNWRGLWVSAMILAQKVWDDVPLKTSSFASILPGVTKDTLRQLEMRAFNLLDYNTSVKLSVYAKYYFELRQLFKEIAGCDTRFTWHMQPLTIVQGRRLEDRSQLKAQKYASRSGSAASSTSPGRGGTSGGQGGTGGVPGDSVPGTPKTQEDIDVIGNRSRYVLS